MANKPTNDAVFATVTVKPPMLTWFGDVLKHWHKQAGSKPTDAMLMVPVLLGLRPGVQALHIAMCLRPEGCTVTQFCLAGSCGPANNMRRDLVKSGWFSSTVEGKPYAYKLNVTAKGEAKLAKAQVALDAAATVSEAPKPAKGKAKKARKPKAANVVTVEAPVNEAPAPAETPISEAPGVTEGTTAEVQPQA